MVAAEAVRVVVLIAAVSSFLGCSTSQPNPPSAARPEESRIPVASVERDDALHLALFWDAKAATPVRKLGTRLVKSDAELRQLLADARSDFSARKVEPIVAIDAAAEVPWGALIDTIATCRAAGMERIEFIVPAPGAASAEADNR